MNRDDLRNDVGGCLSSLYQLHGFSRRALAAHLQMSESTLHGWLKANNLTDRRRGNIIASNQQQKVKNAQTTGGSARGPVPSGVKDTGDDLVMTSKQNLSGTDKLTPEDMFTDLGYDPDDYDYGWKRNNWDVLAGNGVVTTMYQLTVTAKRRIPVDMILPARTDGPRFKQPLMPPVLGAKPIPLFSDAHCPYQDPGLESCALQWLAVHQPDVAWDLGDLADWPAPSRHRPTKGFEATPNECIVGRYEMDRRRREAAPNMVYRVIKGNHDDRPEHALVDKLGRNMADYARAHDTKPVWDLAYVLRYDELGIELVAAEGDYHATTVEIVPGLFARHGTKAGKHGGAVKAIERRNASLAQGHDHKGVLQVHVRYNDHGDPVLVWSISVMAMCLRELESTYMEDPDTAQGFTTITLHPNGRWHPEQAVYDAATKTLTWRDEIYYAAEIP